MKKKINEIEGSKEFDGNTNPKETIANKVFNNNYCRMFSEDYIVSELADRYIEQVNLILSEKKTSW